MKNTRRGLELSATEIISDAERFLQVVEDAARDTAAALTREINAGNPGNFVIHTNQIAALSQIWFWARGVMVDYEATPAVLIAVPKYAHHIHEWDPSDGPVLWWRDPIKEPPYVGTPDDDGFDEGYKWWSYIDIPEIPKEEEE